MDNNNAENSPDIKENAVKKTSATDFFAVILPKTLLSAVIAPAIIFCVAGIITIPAAVYLFFMVLLMWGKWGVTRHKGKNVYNGRIALSIYSGLTILLSSALGILILSFEDLDFNDPSHEAHIPAFLILCAIAAVFSASLIWGIIKPRIFYPAIIVSLALLSVFTVKTEGERLRAIEAEKEFIGRLITLATVTSDADRLYVYEPFLDSTYAVSLNEPSNLKINSDIPRMDGATAFYPVYSAFARAVYPIARYDINDSHVMCSTTEPAYERLINSEADIIFAFKPSKEHLELAESKGVTLEMTPIGKEAFVFFVNAEHPADNLSADEIRDIYSGGITNWRDLGYEDKEIIAYQRAENSGSQTIMREFMGDTELMAAPPEIKLDLMGQILGAVADFRNYDYAIGYSFRFYSTKMAVNDRIKLLSIDGVEPTVETIADGTYPLTYEFYAITAGTSNPNIPALIEWILSEQGRYIVSETGYVSIDN